MLYNYKLKGILRMAQGIFIWMAFPLVIYYIHVISYNRDGQDTTKFKTTSAIYTQLVKRDITLYEMC